MKKIICIALALIFVLGFCACSDNSGYTQRQEDLYNTEYGGQQYATSGYENNYDNNYETETQTTGYEAPSRAYITHVAIQGAVIVKQDGTSSFTYCKKCEACGYIESNMRINANGSGPGKLTSSFYCPKCNNHQDIVIEHYSN